MKPPRHEQLERTTTLLLVLWALAAPSAAQRATPAPAPEEAPASERRARVATLGLATAGTPGLPTLRMAGSPQLGQPFRLEVSNALALSSGFLFLSPALDERFLPALAATVFPGEPLWMLPFGSDSAGSAGPLLPLGAVQRELLGRSFVAQAAVLDPLATGGLAVSRAVRFRFGPAPRPPLFPGTKFPAADGPNSVAIEDLDGDGAADLVIGASSQVSLLFGDGRGSFARPQSSLAGIGDPVAVGDLNADGVADLVISDATANRLAVQLGVGDGTFGPAQGFAVGGQLSNLHYPEAAIADLNADGVPDLAIVILITSTGYASVLLGNGDGTFAAAQTFPVAPGFTAQHVAAADLNGDGALDLAVTRGSGGPREVVVLLGAGDATFGAPQAYATGSSLIRQPLAIGDLDADGAADLVVGDRVLVGAGDGSFPTSQPLPVASRDLALAPLNDDDALDLLVLETAGVRVLFGLGDGTFGAPADPLSAGRAPEKLAVGDLNADGIADLAVANLSSDDVAVYLGLGGGAFGSSPRFPTGAENASDMTLGDLDGDQLCDLVLANRTDPLASLNELTVLRGQADGSFGGASVVPTTGSLNEVVLADLDGDRILDVLLNTHPSVGVFPPSQITVLRGLGGGAFAPPASFPATRPVALAAADLDRDGAPDVAAVSDTGLLSVLLGVGDGTLAAARSFPAGASPVQLAVGDLDTDGVPDVVVANRRSPSTGEIGTVSVLLGAGDGSFSAPLVLPVGLLTGTNAVSIAIGDLDADGAPDLVAAVQDESQDDYVAVLLGHGDGTFDPFTGQAGTDLPVAVAIADLNGDLLADIAAGNGGTEDLTVWLGNGDGSFQPPLAYPLGGPAIALALGDLNGDQVPDLATVGPRDDTVVVLCNRLLD